MMKKSNIEWCDFTWDPVTGCRNDCSFCESRKRLSHFKGDIRFHLSDERIHIDEERSLYVITTPLAKNGSSVPAPTGFYPTLHPYRLQQVIQKIKPANIWVCHSGDLFGEWIPTEWILQVFETANRIESKISGEGFEVHRLKKPEIKRILALYFDASMQGDTMPNIDGEQYFQI